MDVGKLWMAATGCGQPEVAGQKWHRTVAASCECGTGGARNGRRIRPARTGNAECPAGHPAGHSVLTFDVGGDLLSHTLASAVPSALEGLASGFGMGPGVTPPPQPPTTLSTYLTFTGRIHDPDRTHHHHRHGRNPYQGDAGCVLRVTQWMRATTLPIQAE